MRIYACSNTPYSYHWFLVDDQHALEKLKKMMLQQKDDIRTSFTAVPKGEENLLIFLVSHIEIHAFEIQASQKTFNDNVITLLLHRGEYEKKSKKSSHGYSTKRKQNCEKIVQYNQHECQRKKHYSKTN